MRLDIQKLTKLPHFVFQEIPFINTEVTLHVVLLCYIVAASDLLFM